MSYERPQSKNDERADAVMRLVRDGECRNVPEAVRRILHNERVTNELDVKRIMTEVGTLLQARQQQAEEDETWRDMEHGEMLRGSEQAYWQRGGDPRD